MSFERRLAVSPSSFATATAFLLCLLTLLTSHALAHGDHGHHQSSNGGSDLRRSFDPHAHFGDPWSSSPSSLTSQQRAKQPIREHKCIADEIARNEGPGFATPLRYREGAIKEAYQARKEMRSSGERLSRSVPETAPIRIRLDWTYFGIENDPGRVCGPGVTSVIIGSASSTAACNEESSPPVTNNCILTCREEHYLTAEIIDYIQNDLMPHALEFFGAALSLVPVDGNFYLVVAPPTVTTSCNSFVTIPDTYFDPENNITADTVLFVTGRPTIGSTIAYASSCVRDSPYKRPIMGYVNFGPNQVTFDQRQLSMQFAVAVHEISHALGFQSSRFGDFWDHEANDGAGGTVGSLSEVLMENVAVPGLEKSVKYIITENVVAKTREQFGCSTITGAEIEDGGAGGTAGSHWEKRIFMDEFMTGSSTTNPQFSAITLALFEDSGWYYPDYDGIDTRFDWGKDLGCTFLTEKCTQWDGLFCADPELVGCLYDRRAKGTCQHESFGDIDPIYDYDLPGGKGGFSDLADYCPILRPYDDGDCTLAYNYNHDDFYGQSYGDDGRCFMATTADERIVPPDFSPMCFRQVCRTSSAMMIKVGDAWFECSEPTITFDVDVTGYNGEVNCPSISECSGAPSIRWINFESIDPVEGPVSGGQTVTVTGSNFIEGMILSIGKTPCNNVTVESATRATCITPDQSDLYTDHTYVHIGTFDSEGRGGAGLLAYQILVDDTGFLAIIEENIRKLLEFIKKNWWWTFPLIVIIVIVVLVSIFKKTRKPKNAVHPEGDHHHSHSHNHSHHGHSSKDGHSKKSSGGAYRTHSTH